MPLLTSPAPAGAGGGAPMPAPAPAQDPAAAPPMPPPETQAEPMPDADTGGSPVEMSPQEEQLYDAALANIRRRVFGERFEKILDTIGKAHSVPKAVGDMTFELVSEQMSSAIANKKQLPDSIMLELGRSVVNDLTQIAVSGGAWEPADEKDESEMQLAAMNYAAQHYAEMQNHLKRDPKEVVSMLSDVAGGKYDKQLQAASKNEEQ